MVPISTLPAHAAKPNQKRKNVNAETLIVRFGKIIETKQKMNLIFRRDDY